MCVFNGVLPLSHRRNLSVFAQDDSSIRGDIAVSGCKHLRPMVNSLVMSLVSGMNRKVACRSFGTGKCYKYREEHLTVQLAQRDDLGELEDEVGLEVVVVAPPPQAERKNKQGKEDL